MARTQAKVLASIWTDPEWCALNPTAQRLYLLILSQPNLSIAGCIDLMPGRWAKLAAGSSEAAVMMDLVELVARRFVVVDDDEVVVRSFTRNDLAVGAVNVNLVKGFWSAWAGIRSRKLRKVIVDHVPDSIWDRCPDSVPDQAKELRSEPQLELPLGPQSEPSVDLLTADCCLSPASCSHSSVSEIPSPPPEPIAAEQRSEADIDQDTNRAVSLMARIIAGRDADTSPQGLAATVGREAIKDGRRAALRALIEAGESVEDAAAKVADPLYGLVGDSAPRGDHDPAEVAAAAERSRQREAATLERLEAVALIEPGNAGAGLAACRAARGRR